MDAQAASRRTSRIADDLAFGADRSMGRLRGDDYASLHRVQASAELDQTIAKLGRTPMAFRNGAWVTDGELAKPVSRPVPPPRRTAPKPPAVDAKPAAPVAVVAPVAPPAIEVEPELPPTPPPVQVPIPEVHTDPPIVTPPVPEPPPLSAAFIARREALLERIRAVDSDVFQFFASGIYDREFWAGTTSRSQTVAKIDLVEAVLDRAIARHTEALATARVRLLDLLTRREAGLEEAERVKRETAAAAEREREAARSRPLSREALQGLFGKKDEPPRAPKAEKPRATGVPISAISGAPAVLPPRPSQNEVNRALGIRPDPSSRYFDSIAPHAQGGKTKYQKEPPVYGTREPKPLTLADRIGRLDSVVVAKVYKEGGRQFGANRWETPAAMLRLNDRRPEGPKLRGLETFVSACEAAMAPKS